jgi:hypothetical protein
MVRIHENKPVSTIVNTVYLVEAPYVRHEHCNLAAIPFGVQDEGPLAIFCRPRRGAVE